MNTASSLQPLPESAASERNTANAGMEMALPGYRVVRVLGHGAQGFVCQAIRESDGQQVAVKQLNIASVKTWKQYELFQREADVLSHLHIDGVARFFEAVERLEDNPQCSYIVQEYINGRSLAEMLKAGVRFSLQNVYDIVLQLLNILKQLHSHIPPVIHRDIKPSNILLEQKEGDQYKVWLVDFGAVANPQIQSGGSTIAGTFGYMPPEQMMGNSVPASDIYALAAVIVYMLSGRSPSDMPTNDFYLIFEPELQNMPHAVVQTLRRMLDPNANNRLSNIDELMEIWRGFSLNRYENRDLASFALKNNDAAYDKALQKVDEYCAPGNMKLWQMLPEKVPRRKPESYERLSILSKMYKCERRFLSRNCALYHFKEHTHTSALKNKRIQEAVSPGCMGLFLLFFILFSALLLYALLYKTNLFGLSSSSGLSLMPLSLIALFFGFGMMLFYKVVTLRTRVNWRTFQRESGIESIDIIWQRYSNLLENGRKTIAVISSVDYIPADDEYVELGLEEVLDSISKQRPNTGCSLVYHGVPQFRINYSFNPPDDEKTEDLVHSIVLNGLPNETCKPGALLPILYNITRDESGNELVDSMPFPLPLDSVIDIPDVAYLDKV